MRLLCWQFELMSLAIQGPTCTERTNIDFKKFIDSSSSEESNEIQDSKKTKEDSSSEELTDEDLNAIETELSKHVTPEQKAHAMRIFRGFRKGSTENEKNAAMVSNKIRFISRI